MEDSVDSHSDMLVLAIYSIATTIITFLFPILRFSCLILMSRGHDLLVAGLYNDIDD